MTRIVPKQGHLGSGIMLAGERSGLRTRIAATGTIPTSPLLRGSTPFRLSPWALGTQQLVRFRCLASPLAASTPPLSLERLTLTPRIQIRPLALQLFCLTPPAQKIRPLEQPRLNLTKPERPTPQWAVLRSLTAPPSTPRRSVTGPS